MNPITNPTINVELRFFLGLIFNYVVGFLIASGRVDPSLRDTFISQATDLTGYIIIVIASVIGLVHLAKTSHKLTAVTPVSTTNTTKVEVTQETPVSTAMPSQPVLNAGTPLSPANVLREAEQLLNGPNP